MRRPPGGTRVRTPTWMSTGGGRDIIVRPAFDPRCVITALDPCRTPAATTRERKTEMTKVLAISITALVAAFVGGMAPASAAETAAQLDGAFVGTFFSHTCPAGAPAGAICLHDDLAGSFSHFGSTTGSAEVVLDVAHTGTDGCLPVQKRGTFTVANGDQLTVQAAGTFCGDNGTAIYVFLTFGGTGRFAHTTSIGTWVVPPPTTFNGTAGTGNEFLYGLLAGL